MKLKVLYILCFLLLAAFYSCSKDNSNPTVVQPIGNVSVYYPGTIGSKFSYLSSINNVPAGTRVVTIGGVTNFNGNQYTVQKNFIQFGTDTASVMTYYRMKTDTLLFYIDTTGLASFIPAAYRSSISISATPEAKVLAVPLNSGSSWNAYSLNIYLGWIPVGFIKLNAQYAGSESLTLNLTSGTQTKNAEKIYYQLSLTLPDSSSVYGTVQNRNYYAYGWFVDGIGLVKLEGNAAAVEAITRSNITLADTVKTASEILTSCTIK